MLWNNVRDAFPTEIVQMYQALRSAGVLSYATVSKRFTDHQAKWSEAIFNEDAWFKYIDPLVSPDPGKDPTAVYLPMLQGSKAEQRKWWLYNRFRYMDSKWNAGDALSDVIQLRGYAKADITVTPYADIYPTIKYGSYLVAERGHRGTPTLLPCPLDAVNDTEIYIYSASQLASVGDLSDLKVGFADFSKASRMQSIKVGDGSPDYVNSNLTELSIGNSRLLGSVDARNCAALTGSVDLSGASNIETVLLQGTALSSVSLPVGGVLKTLMLPSTISNLTIMNQRYITLFSVEGGEYDTITTLRIENCGDAIPIFDILEDMLAGGRVRLLGMSTAVDGLDDVVELYDRLDMMHGLDENGGNVERAVVSGVITGVAEARRKQLDDLSARYPNVTIECAYVKEGSIVRFYNGDVLLQYIDDSPNGQTAAYTGQTPVHPTDPSSNEFIGWFPSNVNIMGETNCYAQYHDTESIVVKYLEDRLVDFDSEGIDSIRPHAFESSSALRNVTVRGGTIGQYAFSRTNLDHLELIDVGAVSQYAFYLAKVASYGTMRIGNAEARSFYGLKFDELTVSASQVYADAFAYADGNALRLHADGILGDSFYYSDIKRIDVTCPAGAMANDALTYTGAADVIIRCDGFAFNDDRVRTYGMFSCTDDGAVYVPSGQVETYMGKQYSNTYATSHPMVASLEQYPLPDDRSTISDSWAEIVAASANGTYATRYSVGDKKLLELSDGSHVYMHLVAMDADELSDGTGMAHMTWLTGDVIPTGMRLTITVGDDLVGWGSSTLRSFMTDTVAGMVPQVVTDAVKTVRKHSRCFDASGAEFSQTTDDDLWIPSMGELWRDDITSESECPSYGSVVESTYNSGGMMFSGDGDVVYAWTRTANTYTEYRSGGTTVRRNGFMGFRAPRYTSTNSSTSYVMFGFCL